MKKGWAFLGYVKEGIVIRFLDGDLLLVKTDGLSGYEFVIDYLNEMKKHYKNQIYASDLILQKLLGNNYNRIKKIRNIYQSHLAIISIGCAFGHSTDGLHYEQDGNFKFSFSECPIRYICPYNGYKKTNKMKSVYGCNPIFETNLTERQIQITDLLVNSIYDLSTIATILNLNEGRVRNISSEIYHALNVKNRQELTLLLKNKRLI